MFVPVVDRGLARVDAVERALDALETQLYDSGMNGNSSDAQFILKHRRYGTGEAPAVKSNFFLNIALQAFRIALPRGPVNL